MRIGAALLSLLLLACLLWPPEAFESVRDRYLSSERSLLDRQGRLLHRWRVDPSRRRLEWTSLDRVAPFMSEALVRIEDHRFFEHHGVDWIALATIPYRWLKGQTARGGSTLSMQLAGLLDPSLQERDRRRGLLQKSRQILLALRLDLYWSKEDILEAYLNQVSFRGEWEGIAAASQGLFRKDPHGLSRSETLLLVSLLARPNASHERLAQRACHLGQIWNLDCADLRRTLSDALLRLPFFRHRDRQAPHLARLLKENKAQVLTTLDRDMQSFAQAAIDAQMESLKRQNVADAAVLLVEHGTGQVLAYVGSSQRYSPSPEVDGVQALRQAGSTLKPFLYAQAIAMNLLDAESWLYDEPTQIQTATGIYAPQNYDRIFRGPITVRDALAESRNIPAVKVLDLIGVPRFYQLLKDLGFHDLREQAIYGHSLALGAADVSLWDLTQAYATLARQGLGTKLHLLPNENAAAGQELIPPAAAYTIASILSDKSSRVRSFGLDNALATAYWSAVKTGTSKDMRDNWCLGFSDRYTVGVWVGNFDGSPMWNVSGISGAAPIWRQIMDHLQSRDPSHAPSPPPGFHQAPAKALASRKGLLEIRYPVDRSLIAYDPDIPAASQALFFEASGPVPKRYAWELDGKIVKDAWIPIEDLAPGSHVLELKDEKKELVDAVRFELRGKG